MTEHDQGQERAAEFDRERALDSVITEYFADDKDFLAEHEFEDRIGAVYGMLLEVGEDPDVVLGEAGIMEEEDNENEV